MILEKIKPYIGKETTRMRDPISPGARLEATILFLTSGMPYNKMKWSTRISQPSLTKIVPEVCSQIFKEFRNDYMKASTLRGVI